MYDYDMRAYFEETEDCSGGYTRRLSLFPLSQYKFKDPCKLCLVKPICNRYCPDKYKLMAWHTYKLDRLHKIKRPFKSSAFLYLVLPLMTVFSILAISTLITFIFNGL